MSEFSTSPRERRHLIYNPSRDAHAVEDGDVDDRGHPSVVDGLGAVRPHVGTLSQIDVAGAQAETKNTGSEKDKKALQLQKRICVGT